MSEPELVVHPIADAVPVGVVLADPNGAIVYRNRVAAELVGPPPGTGDRRWETWLGAVESPGREELDELLERARAGDAGGQATVIAVSADGTRRWVNLNVVPHLAQDGSPAGTIATLEDVTAQLEARAEADRLTRMLDASSDFVVVWRPVMGEVLWTNSVTRAMLDVPRDDGGARRLRDLLSDEDRERLLAAALDVAERGDVWEGELELLHPVRGRVPVSATAVLQRDEGGQIDTVALVARDISELKAAQARLTHLAGHDDLTGLPNRTTLVAHLERAAARHRRDGGSLAVMFCDLDGFKPVNDQLGHASGDIVLTEVASRLESAIRETDMVARVGGDEFVVVCEAVGDRAVVEEVARRVVRSLEPPILVEGESLAVGCSIGIALVGPDRDPDPDQLLGVADRAMYAAKAEGVGQFVIRELT